MAISRPRRPPSRSAANRRSRRSRSGERRVRPPPIAAIAGEMFAIAIAAAVIYAVLTGAVGARLLLPGPTHPRAPRGRPRRQLRPRRDAGLDRDRDGDRRGRRACADRGARAPVPRPVLPERGPPLDRAVLLTRLQIKLGAGLPGGRGSAGKAGSSWTTKELCRDRHRLRIFLNRARRASSARQKFDHISTIPGRNQGGR